MTGTIPICPCAMVYLTLHSSHSSGPKDRVRQLYISKPYFTFLRASIYSVKSAEQVLFQNAFLKFSKMSDTLRNNLLDI